ncbi:MULTISPECIES: MFS transporter [unclassified Pseudomonas]|uniref:MFS transporter n=1 Tax=unclassified Pseudomonas TaxID=196821 RepID=UPI0016450B29|nr:MULTISPECIES: MFS transporter [unclassified Pseudomonas]MBC3420117.1 MFS transporter [Pseudomonas sp. RW3S2]MBC3467986.1 MFS transporter [Pseudomonas sp. RW10S2]
MNRPGLSVALLSAVVVPQVGLGIMVPASVQLAEQLQSGLGQVQSTLVMYMVGYALSMMLAGLLSDRYGPRAVQLGGLLLAALGTGLAASATSFVPFMIGRLLQALGGCVGTVTTRMVVREVFAEHERMGILTTLASAIAITPCLAPLLGGALLPQVGWRGILGLVGVFNLLVLLVFWRLVPRLPGTGQGVAVGTILRVYRRNLGTGAFVFHASCISLVWMSYFAFLSSSSYAFQRLLGFSAFEYGALIAICALGYVTGSFLARRLSRRHDLTQILAVGAGIGTVGWGGLWLAVHWIGPTAGAFVVPMMAILLSTGMVIPATQAGLLRCVQQDIGLSTGQFFFLQMASGAAYGLVASHWPDLDVRQLALLVGTPMVLLTVLVGTASWRHRLKSRAVRSVVSH